MTQNCIHWKGRDLVTQINECAVTKVSLVWNKMRKNVSMLGPGEGKVEEHMEAARGKKGLEPQ